MCERLHQIEDNQLKVYNFLQQLRVQRGILSSKEVEDALFGPGYNHPTGLPGNTTTAPPLPSQPPAQPPPARPAPPPGTSPASGGIDPSTIPLTSERITKAFVLKRIAPTYASTLPANFRGSLSADASIVYDAPTNSITITDQAAKVHRFAEILAQLDTQWHDVTIKALVANIGPAEVKQIFDHASGVSTNSNPPGLSTGFLGKSANETLTDLVNNNKLEVISRPHLLADNKQKSTLDIGKSIQYIAGYLHNKSPTATLAGGDPGQEWIADVKFKQVGLSLAITPAIGSADVSFAGNAPVHLSGRLVILDIECTYSQLLRMEESPAPDTPPEKKLKITKPILDEHTFKTRVAVVEGNTIVLTIPHVPAVPPIETRPIGDTPAPRPADEKQILLFLTPAGNDAAIKQLPATNHG